MITNTQLLPVTVEMILKHSHSFYLTGSRFFGNANEKSDWDFFTLYDKEVRRELLDYGFERNTDETYSGDTEIVEVLSKDCFNPTTGTPVKVDVQLLKALTKKVAVQEALKQTWNSGTGLPGNKLTQRCLWFAAYAGYDIAKKMSNVI